MKKIVFALLMTMGMLNAQNNLVFNRVLNFKLTSSQTATVPAGKVWKVENFTNQSGTGADNFYLYTSDADYGLPTITNGYIDSTEGGIVWLKEGSDISGYASNGTLFSILEFDVVPVSTTSTGSGGLSSEGLEFNQVINYSNNVIVGGYGEIIDVLEVPQGKVWKITRVTILGRPSSTTAPGGQYRPYDVDQISVELGGINLFYRPSNSGYSNSSFENYPVWINSGTKDLVVGKYDGSSGSSFKITLSAIEYNIPQ